MPSTSGHCGCASPVLQVPSDRFPQYSQALSKEAFCRVTPERPAPGRNAPDNVAPFKVDPVKLQAMHWTLLKLAPVKSALVRLNPPAPSSLPASTAPTKSA